MMFDSREDAGRRLGELLRDRSPGAGLVLGLPRGGIVVAAEIARVLRRPLGALVVRKIGHPFHREFAVGALAEEGIVVLDQPSIGANAILRPELDEVISAESERLRQYERKFHGPARRSLRGESVLLVDDGLATGATMEAAALSARKQEARIILVAVPVASTNAVDRLQAVADEIIALWVDPDFDAVGGYYKSFEQVTDDVVAGLLKGSDGQ